MSTESMIERGLRAMQATRSWRFEDDRERLLAILSAVLDPEDEALVEAAARRVCVERGDNPDEILTLGDGSGAHALWREGCLDAIAVIQALRASASVEDGTPQTHNEENSNG